MKTGRARTRDHRDVRGRGPRAVEFSEIKGRADERPLGLGISQSSDGPLSELLVVFDLAEDKLHYRSALFQGLSVALGGVLLSLLLDRFSGFGY